MNGEVCDGGPWTETWDGTCPWCGKELGDLWERVIGQPSGAVVRVECEHCGAMLDAARHVSVDYQLTMVEAGKGKERVT